MRSAHQAFVRRAALAVVVLAVVTGCSTPAPVADSELSPLESQQALFAVLDETQRAAGGEWETQDSPSPRPCTLPGSGDDGVTFSGRRLRDGVGPSADETDAIVAGLEKAGFEVGRETVGGFDNVRAVMPGNGSYYVLLEAGTNVTALSGQAACVPGDIIEELQRVKDS